MSSRNDSLERHKMFAFKDAKSLTYGPPFAEENRGKVIRSIQEQMAQGQAVWAKHPQDFTLFELGEYDIREGTFHPYDTKIAVGLVQDFKISLDGSR